ncbi:hypothetical protein HY641_01850 [Candidatus Woesearchaeota archaeon]|nr:hypothetical protein [Candidatus Woesearchaeota archaeon]
MKHKSNTGQSMQAKHPDYFEGCLQLRNPNPDLIAYVQRQLRENPDVHIAKEIPQPDGVDLWMSSNKFLLKLGKGLAEAYNGDLKVTNRLHTKNRLTSRDVYRMTVYFKRASFKRGDEVDLRGTRMRVLGGGKRIRLQEVQSGKKHELTFAEVQEAFEKQQKGGL